MARLAGIELGGTKSVAILSQGDVIAERVEMPTRSPDDTLGQLAEVLHSWDEVEPIQGLGIASFGPVRLDTTAADYGVILQTPKPGWSGAPVGHILMQAVSCPWMIDTDVNAAALGEHAFGSARGCHSLCYITVGTGIGVGLIIDGKAVHGGLHPEGGHMRVRRASEDNFAGACPFHGDCIEGLASGPALAARFGQPSAEIPDDHPMWDWVAADLAELIGAVALIAAPQRIVLGGTVCLTRSFLLPSIRRKVAAGLNGYLPELADDAIVLAGLGGDAGPVGAIRLAAMAHRSRV